MSHGAIAALFAAAAVLALALLVPVGRKAVAAHDLDTSAVLAFATATFFSLSSAVVAVTGQLQRIPDAFGNLTTIDPSWFHRVDQASILLLVAVIGLALWRQVSSGTLTVHAAGVLAIALGRSRTCRRGSRAGASSPREVSSCSFAWSLRRSFRVGAARPSASVSSGSCWPRLAGFSPSFATTSRSSSPAWEPAVGPGSPGCSRTRTCSELPSPQRSPSPTSAFVAVAASGCASTSPRWRQPRAVARQRGPRSSRSRPC